MRSITLPQPVKKKPHRPIKKAVLVISLGLMLILMLSGCAAQSDEASENGVLGGLLGSRAETIDILLLLTVLSVLPSVLIMLTCFPRIVIVLSLIRNGLGLQQMPPNQVLIGLSLFITFFVMSPVIEDINVNAYQPYVAEQIDTDQALERAMEPIRDFMFRQTYKSDLDYFVSISPSDSEVQNPADVSNTALIPAFITSEIKRGFQIGFLLYIPFIVLDMIVASALMSMGMMMLPPIVISLPFKVLLFVLVDGWSLAVRTLINSFG